MNIFSSKVFGYCFMCSSETLVEKQLPMLKNLINLFIRRKTVVYH